MMIRTLTQLSFLICLFNVNVKAQSNNLTGSPYSLFGLGVESNTNTGINSGMGQLGIALEGGSQINLYNPASFASIDKKRVVYDVGFFAEMQNIYSNGNQEERISSNFSNFAFGFNGNGKYGVGVSLTPVTSVGYTLVGLQSTIEGSTESFITNIEGSGGLNEIRLDYGRQLFDNLNVGMKFSYLFGNIEETESIIAESNLVSTNDITYYSGATFGFGLQYRLLKHYNLGFTLDLPTSLAARQDTYSEKTSFDAVTTLEESTNKSVANFRLPLKLGFGFSANYENLLLAADYTSRLWGNTNQDDGVGEYINQYTIALGTEYVIKPNSTKYWERVRFRAGINYDSGYLEINDYNVSSLNTSLGLGFPMGRRKGTYLNISFNMARTGTDKSFLVEENTGTLNVNLTLSSIWFQKRLFK